jgi:hypothetical protein
LICEGEYNNNLKHGWMAPHVLPKPPKTRDFLLVETDSNRALRWVTEGVKGMFATNE